MRQTKARAKLDTDLTADDLKRVRKSSRRLFATTRQAFSDDPYRQLEEAVKAVFRFVERRPR